MVADEIISRADSLKVASDKAPTLTLTLTLTLTPTLSPTRTLTLSLTLTLTRSPRTRPSSRRPWPPDRAPEIERLGADDQASLLLLPGEVELEDCVCV